MKNQTAVEFFYDKIKSHFEHDGDLVETLTFTFSIAKQKERKQIIDAYCAGNPAYKEMAEEFYYETYSND